MNADRKQAEEFVKNKLNEKTGQGITLYEHYLANDTTISIGTAVSWIVEFYQLSSPLPEITEEEIKARALKETEIYEKMIPYGARINIILEDMAVWALDLVKCRLSERKEQKTTEQVDSKEE